MKHAVQDSLMFRLPGLRRFRERIRQLARQVDAATKRAVALEQRLACAAKKAEAERTRAAEFRDAARKRERGLRRKLESERRTQTANSEAHAQRIALDLVKEALARGDSRILGKSHWRALVDGFRALGERDRLRFLRHAGPHIPPRRLRELGPLAPGQLDFPDARILMRVTSPTERVRLRACAKEPWTVDWLRQMVGPGDVLYDIGANVGAYSLVAAKKPEGGARVYAFEPSYANLLALCENILLNDVASSVTPLPVALSDHNGLDAFRLHSMLPGTAWHTLAGTGPPLKPVVVYNQPTITYRLDDLIDVCGLPEPNHIKLDVDGCELALLRGASRTLRSPSVRSLLIEIMRTTSDEVSWYLTECGLRLHMKIDCKPKKGEDIIWYGIFVRDSQSAQPSHSLR